MNSAHENNFYKVKYIENYNTHPDIAGGFCSIGFCWGG